MRAELEYKIIGSVLMLEGESRNRIFSTIGDEYLSDSTARRIYIRLRDMCREHPNAECEVLVSGLDRDDQDAALTAVSRLMSPNIAERHLDENLRAIKQQHDRQALQSKAQEMLMSGDLSAGGLRELTEFAESLSRPETTSAQRYLESFGEPITLLPTGFPVLDEMLGGGFRAGTLATIGARPSTGKTTFAINVASHSPERRMLFFSLEMSAGMIYDRLISDAADVDYSITSRHQYAFETAKAVVEKYGGLEIIDDVTDVERITELIYTHKPEIAFIDFIQIVTSQKRFTDNRQRIDHISQTLKRCAKQTSCCIVTLSQLTRSGKEDPSMSDLKESGGLEQDGDYVLILKRPFVIDKSSEGADPSKTILKLDKNKFGNTRELSYSFDGKHQRFTEQEGIAKPKKSGAGVNDLPF